MTMNEQIESILPSHEELEENIRIAEEAKPDSVMIGIIELEIGKTR